MNKDPLEKETFDFQKCKSATACAAQILFIHVIVCMYLSSNGILLALFI